MLLGHIGRLDLRKDLQSDLEDLHCLAVIDKLIGNDEQLQREMESFQQVMLPLQLMLAVLVAAAAVAIAGLGRDCLAAAAVP